MTPKEKAEELKWKYLPILDGWTSSEKSILAKQCAIIAVDEILKAENIDYQQVKKELEK